jgi:hypothetical protein
MAKFWEMQITFPISATRYRFTQGSNSSKL